MVVAIRAATDLQAVRDSVEIVVVSPFATDAFDAATASIRRVWPGRVRVMRAGAPPNDTTRARPLEIRAASGDPVLAALALAGTAPDGVVRLVRDSTTPADTAWARAGGAVVVWPRDPTERGWQARAAVDTAFGVTVVSSALVSPMWRGRSATVVAPAYLVDASEVGNAILPIYLLALAGVALAYALGASVSGPWGGSIAALALLSLDTYRLWSRQVMTDVPSTTLLFALAWLHVPAVAWGVWVELAGWICPLTPLENWLRMKGGVPAYGTSFIGHYLVPVLYPAGLTRTAPRSCSRLKARASPRKR